jgi:hypothetical protein
MDGDRDGVQRSRCRRLLTAATALNKEGQKEEDVNRQHREKNLFEPFPPIELWVTD